MTWPSGTHGTHPGTQPASRPFPLHLQHFAGGGTVGTKIYLLFLSLSNREEGGGRKNKEFCVPLRPTVPRSSAQEFQALKLKFPGAAAMGGDL